MIEASDLNDRKIFNEMLVHFQFVANMFVLKAYLESIGSQRDTVVETLIDQWKENLEQTVDEGLSGHKLMLDDLKEQGVDIEATFPTTAEMHEKYDGGMANAEKFLRHVLSN